MKQTPTQPIDWNTLTRKQAIKLKCLDCCNGYAQEVRKCTATNCPLYIFRSGVKKPDKTQ